MDRRHFVKALGRAIFVPCAPAIIRPAIAQPYLGRRKQLLARPPLAVSSIANNVLWVDGSNAGSITQSGGVISQWNDLSGNANNLTQATVGQRPTVLTADQNGLNTVGFSASSSQVFALTNSINLDASVTLVAVMKINASGHGEALGVVGNSQIFIGDIYASSSTVYAQNSAREVYATGLSLGTAYYLFAIRLDHTTGDIYYNFVNRTSGTPSVSVANATVTHVGFGETFYMDGAIAEMLVFSRVLTGRELSRVEQYLKSKWAV